MSAEEVAKKLKQSDKKGIMPFQKSHLKDSGKHLDQSVSRNVIPSKTAHSNSQNIREGPHKARVDRDDEEMFSIEES